MLLAPRATLAPRRLALAIQLGYGLVVALERTQTPDDEREKAILLAGALPESAVLLAGPVAHHVRWLTAVPVVALPNEIQAAAPGPDGPRDPLDVVRAVAAREAATHDSVYISSEALDYLEWRFRAFNLRISHNLLTEIFRKTTNLTSKR